MSRIFYSFSLLLSIMFLGCIQLKLGSSSNSSLQQLQLTLTDKPPKLWKIVEQTPTLITLQNQKNGTLIWARVDCPADQFNIVEELKQKMVIESIEELSTLRHPAQQHSDRLIIVGHRSGTRYQIVAIKEQKFECQKTVLMLSTPTDFQNDLPEFDTIYPLLRWKAP